ncbi:MAG: DUF456 family protein [Betaproteobacteria bacterium]|nr:DUF456 family protein [Betaproteobacteria bacterium]
MDPAYLHAIAAILVIVGLAGTVVPLLPGIAFVFGGLLLAAWADDFQRVGALALTILGLLTVLAIAADLLASAFGAKRMGASPRAIVGATLGAVVGIFFGLPGLVVGPFVGAVVGELSANRELLHAGRAGLGTWLGLLLGSIAKLTLAFLMVGVFATAWFFSG